jgi:hypothetical protein
MQSWPHVRLLDPLAFEFDDGRIDVIAHEVKSVMTVVSRMGGQLCGRKGEIGHSWPASTDGNSSTSRRERANGVCVPGEDNGVDAVDHGRMIMSPGAAWLGLGV